MIQILFRVIGAALLVGSLWLGWIWMGYQHFVDQPLVLHPAQQRLIIAPGSSLTVVAQQLTAAGIINEPHYFQWLARLQGEASNIKAGEYILVDGVTPQGLLAQLVAGKVLQHTLTLIEGETFAQLLATIRASTSIKQTLKGLSPQQVMEQLGYPERHPEGWLMPDTYHFPIGTSDLEFIRRAFLVMEEYLQQAWEQRDQQLPLKSPYEALILASIIEKETAKPAERPQIAGVFARRLEKRMRLQTDPTVIYGLGEGFDGNLRRRDLKQDNPYNTYTRHGLPPTPIAQPGRAAIDAALHPAAGSALYFVARGDGSHHFSDSLKEHNRAVIQYQLKGRKRSFSSYPLP